jgi:hypothetical protein
MEVKLASSKQLRNARLLESIHDDFLVMKETPVGAGVAESR